MDTSGRKAFYDDAYAGMHAFASNLHWVLFSVFLRLSVLCAASTNPHYHFIASGADGLAQSLFHGGNLGGA